MQAPADFAYTSEHFPVKADGVYLSHCGISPMYAGAVEASHRFQLNHARRGAGVFSEYGDILGDLRRAVGRFLGVDGQDIAFLKNTAEGLSLIAAGFPFAAGDEIISYVHEYPSNHYPWRIQSDRGATLRLLGNHTPADQPERVAGTTNPVAFDLNELEAMITPKTRIVAVSHVQFTSGFAVDLQKLGAICRAHQVHLVVDAAQSFGCLPIAPGACGIDAIASAGWKWLLGPIGSGLLYTTPAFREKIAHTMAGADIVTQGEDYLDHTWQPHSDARRFEYSTAPVSQAVALRACFDDLLNRHGIAAIHKRGQALRARVRSTLNAEFFALPRFAPENESGILSALLPESIEPNAFARNAAAEGVFVSSRGGYLRIAPHFCTTDAELDHALQILNRLADQG